MMRSTLNSSRCDLVTNGVRERPERVQNPPITGQWRLTCSLELRMKSEGLEDVQMGMGLGFVEADSVQVMPKSNQVTTAATIPVCLPISSCRAEPIDFVDAYP